jgi:lipopolysaccharide transport system ATP-binding protein
MKPAIQVSNLSKKYQIGSRQNIFYRTLRESLVESAAAPLRHLTRIFSRAPHNIACRQSETDFWALKEVSFEVQPGEMVGIIGRNGAGKSTLLKILSRITEPTGGRVEMRGRVASLLEVGTGFHAELTGRENIFLNGSILGMSRHEIQKKFDEIVAFSEIEQFLDTPVKRYSSGMYVRLAFAVAAHLEPEILIVDEVLAVGDGSFQKKCLSKMEDVGHEGRTVLFVSHNMTAVTRVCPRAILLEEGHVKVDDISHRVVADYLRPASQLAGSREWPDQAKAPGNNIVRLRALRVRCEDGQTAQAVDIRRPVGVEMEFEVLRPGHELVPHLHFRNEEGVYVFVCGEHSWRRKPRPAGIWLSTLWIPGNMLAEGSLFVGAAVSTIHPTGTLHFFEKDAMVFRIFDSLDGDSARGDYAGAWAGVIRPMFSWKSQVVTNSSRAPALLLGGIP